jgi:hypothetical protein
MEQAIIPIFYLQMDAPCQFVGDHLNAKKGLEEFRIMMIPELDELGEI